VSCDCQHRAEIGVKCSVFRPGVVILMSLCLCGITKDASQRMPLWCHYPGTMASQCVRTKKFEIRHPLPPFASLHIISASLSASHVFSSVPVPLLLASSQHAHPSLVPAPALLPLPAPSQVIVTISVASLGPVDSYGVSGLRVLRVFRVLRCVWLREVAWVTGVGD
jgi:hypothetical protein